jgi:hypothetical protein
MTDLNSLVQPDSSLDLLLANDINDRDEIVGFGLDTNSGATVAFLAVPVQENDAKIRTAGSSADRSWNINSARTIHSLPSFARFAAGITGAR